jgi:hypothetical protein
MSWLKRNLVLVVGGLVALGLLGLAGYYLYTKIEENTAVSAKLEQTTTELKTLVGRDPHPGPEPIAAAKEEQVKLKAFLDQVKTHFSPPPSTNQLTSREFRNRLDNTIAELKRSAALAGVQLETNYWFSFEAHKTAVNFATNHVSALASQLVDIRTLCHILYDAKVLKVTGVKRVAVTSDDTGTSDYVSTKATTNAWAIIMPYEVSFDAFSSELAAVLKGLLKSRDCFVVKNITVEKAADAQVQQEQQPAGSQPFNYMDRYGLRPNFPFRGGGEGGRYSRPMPTAPPPPVKPAGPGGWSTVLDEKTLRVTLTLDAVKLKAQN